MSPHTCQNAYNNKKTTNDKCWWGGEERKTFGGNVNWCTTVDNSIDVSQRLKIELSYDIAILLLAIYTKKKKKTTSLIEEIHEPQCS